MGAARLRVLSALAAFLFAFSSSGQLVFGQEATPSVQAAPVMCCNPTTGVCVLATTSASAETVTAHQSVNLDLSSTNAAVSTPATLQTPVNINVGGAVQTVNPGQMLTPAQLVAVYQVMHTGAQNIVMGANGAATGGSMTIGNWGQHLSSLTVPQGVTVINKAATLNLTGNLTNAGTIFAVSTNPAVTTSQIAALNILNQQGALLTSVLPAGGLAGVTNAIQNLNLNLTAVQSIFNSGSIASAANLTMTAGGDIINSGTLTSAGNLSMIAVGVISNQAAATITAAQNVNITSLIGNITNAGTIAATTGNININSILGSQLAAQTMQNLNMDNTGGTLQALMGSINVGNTLSQTNINLRGGDWLSKELNLNAVYGITGAVDRIAGGVNVTGATASISNTAGDLNLQSLNLSGDPIFSSVGNLALVDFNPGGQSDFIALAGGNITGTNTQINTRGGQIFISAGYQFTVNNAACNPCINGVDFTVDTNTVTTPGASVDIGGGSLLQSSGTAVSGPIRIQAPDAITVGNILTAGAGGTVSTSGNNGGNVMIEAAQDITTGFIRSFGGGAGGGQFGAAPGAGGNGGNIIVASINGGVTIGGDINSSGGGGGGGSTGGAGGAGGTVTITTQGALTISGPILAAGGGNGGSLFPGSTGGIGGGGSFGGGGGAAGGVSPTVGIGFNGAGGGGGFFGGGGSGGDVYREPDQGGSGGGGGYLDGGGGGGGGGQSDDSAGSGGGGGGGGAGFGGGGGGTGGPTIGRGGHGGAGGQNGANGISDNPNGTLAPGGSSISGGAGGPGQNVLSVQEGGAGGAGGGTGSGDGVGGRQFSVGGIAGSGGRLGQGGTSHFGSVSQGADVGSANSGAGGAITVTGSTVRIDNSIAGFGLAPSLFDTHSVNSQGTGGTISITTTGVGTSFTVGSPAGSGSLGALTATGGITINGVAAGTSVTTGTFSTQTPTPPPPTPTPSTSSSTPTLTSQTTSGAGLLAVLPPSGNNVLDVQIGTKIPTDVTSIVPPGETEQQAARQPLTGQIVAYGDRLIDAVVVNNSQFSSSVVSSLQASGVTSGVNSGGSFFNLDRGSAIFSPNDGDIVVRTHEGDIHIAQGSVVQVYETGANVAILNLDDVRKGAVRIVAGDRVLTLQPGKELVLTRETTPSFERVNPMPRIATRNTSKLELGDRLTGFLSEFSIPSALTQIIPLKKLVASVDPRDRRLAHSLLKNAVLFTHFAATAGPYKASSQ